MNFISTTDLFNRAKDLDEFPSDEKVGFSYNDLNDSELFGIDIDVVEEELEFLKNEQEIIEQEEEQPVDPVEQEMEEGGDEEAYIPQEEVMNNAIEYSMEELDAFFKNYDEMVANEEQQKIVIQELNDLVHMKESELKLKSEEFEELKAAHSTLQNTLEQVKAEKETLQSNLDSLQHDMGEMLSGAPATVIQDPSPSSPFLDDDSIVTFTTLSVNPYTFQELQTQIEEMQIENQKLRMKEGEYITQLNTYQTQLEVYAIDSERRVAQISELERINQVHEETTESLRGTMREDRLCMEQLKRVSDNQSSMIESLKKQLEQAIQKNNQLHDQIQSIEQMKEEEKKKWEEEKKGFCSEQSELSNELDRLRSEITELHQVIDLYQQESCECDSDDSFYSIQEEPEEIVQPVIPPEAVEILFSDTQESVVLFMIKEDNAQAIEQLQSRISQMTEKAVHNENELRNQREQYQQKMNEVQSNESEITSLKGMISQYQIELKQAEEESTKLNHQILSLHATIQEKDTQINQIQEVENDLQKQITELTTIIQTSKATESLSEKNSKDLDTSLKSLQKAFNAKNEEVVMLKSELEQQRVLYDTLESSHTELQALHQQKNKDYSSLLGQMKMMKEESVKAAHELKQKCKTSQQKTIELAKSEITKRELQIQDLTKKYQEALITLQSVSKGEAIQQDSRVTQLKLQIMEYEQTIGRLKKEVNDKVKENEKNYSLIEELRKMLKKKENLVEELNIEINKKESQLRAKYYQ